jgi:hypothetical protein
VFPCDHPDTANVDDIPFQFSPDGRRILGRY